MATYLELFSARNDSDLQDKVVVAVTIAAEAIRTDVSPPTNQAQREAWAVGALSNPTSKMDEMLWAIISTNKDATLSAIVGASDSAIQTNVDAAVDLFAGS